MSEVCDSLVLTGTLDSYFHSNPAFEIENIYSEIKVRHYMNGANAVSLDIK